MSRSRNVFPPGVANDINEILQSNDEVEGKLDDVIKELQDIESDLDDDVEVKLDAVISELQDIESDIETVDTTLKNKLNSVISELQDIEQNQDEKRDTGFIISETISAGGTISRELDAFGGSSINGQFISTGKITLKIQWLDAVGGSVVREQNVINNAVADNWKIFQLNPSSPYVNLILEDESGSDQTVNATYHYN